MGVILDTTVLIEAERGRLEIDRFIVGKQEKLFGLSVITAAELLHRVHRADSAKRRRRRSAYVEKLIELFPLYAFDLAAAGIYADLWDQLLREGKIIGAHDLMIGSTALAFSFSVATFNKREFERIEGLEVELLTS